MKRKILIQSVVLLVSFASLAHAGPKEAAPSAAAPAPVAAVQPAPSQAQIQAPQAQVKQDAQKKVIQTDWVMAIIQNFLSRPELGSSAGVCQAFDAGSERTKLKRDRAKLIQAWPGYEAFDNQFVKIPAGLLPPTADFPAGEPVASFGADKYPVTRELWAAIMDGKPADYPDDGTWDQDLRKPVTHVNWENEDGSPAEVQEFLLRLNQRTASQRCTYDLPTDKQLWYRNRADVTGKSLAKYSVAKDPLTGALFDVNDANVNLYVNHYGSNPRGLQPVGSKLPNAFGVELGNVWVMSKDLYDPAHPNWGRSIRGGSWDLVVSYAASVDRCRAGAGDRFDSLGFALVRTCF